MIILETFKISVNGYWFKNCILFYLLQNYLGKNKNKNRNKIAYHKGKIIFVKILIVKKGWSLNNEINSQNRDEEVLENTFRNLTTIVKGTGKGR